MSSESYEDWLSGFAANRLTAEELERLLTRSVETSDEDLHRLVNAHMFLRRLVREGVLPMLGNTSTGIATEKPALIESLRRLVRDD